MKYEIYKTTSRSIVVMDRKVDKAKALTIANEHFKTSKDNLIIERGRTIGDEVVFPNKAGDVWCIYRKGIS
jgi:hypothetical protein